MYCNSGGTAQAHGFARTRHAQYDPAMAIWRVYHNISSISRRFGDTTAAATCCDEYATKLKVFSKYNEWDTFRYIIDSRN